MPDVVLYVRSWCPWCHQARELLATKGVRPREIDIEQDPGRQAEMIERANGRTTVPQVFIGGRHVGGFDDLAALDARGELDRLLAQAHPVGENEAE